MNIDNTVTGPAVKYFGGKWRLAEWIISYFPDHSNYLEPCGGGASILLRKPRCLLETFNDLDHNVVNYFRVLRERTQELIDYIWMTPWSREEHDLCRSPHDDPLESARRFYCSAMMNRARGPHDKTDGIRFSNDGRSNNQIKNEFSDYRLENLRSVAERLKGVQIECRDYREVIKIYDTDDTLIYFDPPYVMDSRTGKGYAIEFSDNMHREASELLKNTKGYVVISGYACSLYSELYEAFSWRRVDKASMTNASTEKIESLWLSPKTIHALDQAEAQPALLQV